MNVYPKTASQAGAPPLGSFVAIPANDAILFGFAVEPSRMNATPLFLSLSAKLKDAPAKILERAFVGQKLVFEDYLINYDPKDLVYTQTEKLVSGSLLFNDNKPAIIIRDQFEEEILYCVETGVSLPAASHRVFSPLSWAVQSRAADGRPLDLFSVTQ